MLSHTYVPNYTKAAVNVILLVYTPQKMFLLAFSFANFEVNRGNTGKANISKVNYTAQKKVSPQFSKFANEKARRNFIWGVYVSVIHKLSDAYNTPTLSIGSVKCSP